MFGMRKKAASKLASGYKDPTVEDAKVDAVDTGESFRAEKSEASKDKKQSFKEAFNAAADGSTFSWNGKQYKKEYAKKDEPSYRPGGRGPLTRNGGSFPESKKNTPGGRGPLTRSSTGPASKPKTESSAPAAGSTGYKTRSGSIAPSGFGALADPFGTHKKTDEYLDKIRAYKKAHGFKEPAKPDLSIGQIPALKERSDAFYEAQRKNREAQQRKMEESGTKPRYGMAKGGSVGYAEKEKEHVRQMKKHGVPKKFVKEEEQEAKGMKCGGGVMKYAKGGGIERKGKTQAKMVRMASGGSVSARADGIASRGKTKCKIC